MRNMDEVLPVKCLGGAFMGNMTRKQAERLAAKLIDSHLKFCGFAPVIVRCTYDLNGWNGYRIAYGHK